MALNTALAIAAATPVIPISPIPWAPTSLLQEGGVCFTLISFVSAKETTVASFNVLQSCSCKRRVVLHQELLRLVQLLYCHRHGCENAHRLS